jgi:signal transduction histidine kinase/CheY-like chemotaxis protein
MVLGARQRDPDGSALLVGSARNITELKRAEQDRRQLDRHMQETQRLESLGVLAGGVAHDFNNLLTVIRGNTGLMLEDLPSDWPQRERLTRIQAAAEYAQALTRQMLTYSGKASLTLRPLDVSQVALDMLDLLRASVEKKGQLDVDLDDDLPAVEGDDTQIRQVLLNLVTNAAEALHDQGGSILIRTRLCHVSSAGLIGAFGKPDPKPGEYVAVEVSDTGQGIAATRIARVFEPFFTSKASGRGLGLAAVLGIVRAHGGVIQLETELGEGTTFRVLLPASLRAVSQPAPVSERSQASGGSGTILVVDDEEAVIEIAQEILERAGFRVFTAASGREAVDLLQTHGADIDAVVLDLMMPEMGGAETFDALRSIRPELPILVVSGYDKEMASEHFVGRGIAGFLYKPYEPDELVERVRNAVSG